MTKTASKLRERKPPISKVAVSTDKNGKVSFVKQPVVEEMIPTAAGLMKKNLSVLVIDDDSLHFDWMEQLVFGDFASRFKEVEFSTNFENALKTLQSKKFDVVITDTVDHECEFERAIGAKVIRLAKKANPNCHVVGMSRHIISKEVFLLMGADDFFDKEAGINQIKVILEKFFKNGTNGNGRNGTNGNGSH